MVMFQICCMMYSLNISLIQNRAHCETVACWVHMLKYRGERACVSNERSGEEKEDQSYYTHGSSSRAGVLLVPTDGFICCDDVHHHRRPQITHLIACKLQVLPNMHVSLLESVRKFR